MDKEQFLIDLSGYERGNPKRVPFASLSLPQRVFTSVWNLESYVGNCGFLFFFESEDGATANFAPAALRTIGAHTTAELVERALKAISPEPLPESLTERTRLLESLDEEVHETLHALDDEFFRQPDDLTELLFAYVKSKPEVFGEVSDESPSE